MPQCISSLHLFCSLIDSSAIRMCGRSGSSNVMYSPESGVKHVHDKKKLAGQARTRTNLFLKRNRAEEDFVPPAQVQRNQEILQMITLACLLQSIMYLALLFYANGPTHHAGCPCIARAKIAKPKPKAKAKIATTMSEASQLLPIHILPNYL